MEQEFVWTLPAFSDKYDDARRVVIMVYDKDQVLNNFKLELTSPA